MRKEALVPFVASAVALLWMVAVPPRIGAG
jgi:hypothetical protein